MISRPTPIAPGVDQPQAAVLAAEGVSVRFGGLTAIGDVTLSLERSKILGLIGPNGAGKTTLVNCMTGFQAPTEGRILLGGSSTAGWTAEHFRHQGVARTFQAGRLFKGLTVLENVEVTGTGMGLSRRQAHKLALEMVDWLGLSDRADTVAGALPYTDERRVGIARALLLGPAFLLLDEPAAGMSDAECDELLRIVTAIPKTFACGILLIEHNMRMVMGACDLIHVLDSGRTIAEGTPAEIQRNKAVLAAYLGSEGEKQLEMAEHHA
ncbi:MAG TPA: ABC transporter ATP-binding protein [Geminicoccus sp.]|uniref:ABC transporter ATP-binding protein n=1 Tax=Geminicoccus sp. TaxID=2024832 RepID=UPI002E35DCB2|nr:ABC transporter ATP-binding protein [Geminicoccus sp.]HEX2528226.1 ABC transporter ATP-binding protein [Geminicoccus sp.]